MFKFFVLFSSIFLIMTFSTVNAETVIIPEWVLSVHSFWTEEKISDEEFITMLTYMENNKIIDLILHKTYDIKTNFLLSISQNQNFEQYTSCNDGWYLTGYFTPVESEYSGNFVTINIDDSSREFRQDFVDAVQIEGWGKTLYGDYLGWYANSFHLSNNALDLDGEVLTAGKIAIDTTILDHDAKVVIPTLPEPWNEIIFISSDEGTSIKGKHIDLFTGEGKLAEDETFRVTSYDNKVCE